MRRGQQAALEAAALVSRRSSSRRGVVMRCSSVTTPAHQQLQLQQGRRALHNQGIPVTSLRGHLEHQHHQQQRRPVGVLGVQQPPRSIQTLSGLAGRTAVGGAPATPFTGPSPTTTTTTTTTSSSSSSLVNRTTTIGGAQRSLATSPENASGGGFATERDYHAAADEALEEVQALLEGLEDAVEDFEVNYSQGVLNVVMGEHGIWVLNKQTPNRQVWWSSPISGPLRFEYDAGEGKWRTTRDRRELFALLAEEVRTVSGVDILEGQ